MFNYLYKKETLDLYTFLFYNKAIGEFNKDKIKNILYVSFTYIQLNFNDMKIDKVIDYFSHIESIDYLDNLMLNNEKIKKYYNLYPIHNDLNDEETKNRYIEGLKLIKEEISKLSISEYGIYIKAKEDIYNILEQSLNKEISLEQLQVYESMFLKNLEILGKYMDKKDIEAYKTYFNVKSKKDKNILLKGMMKVFDNKINNFSELDLLKDLKYKSNYANKLNKNNLEYINLYKKEISNLRIIELKKAVSNFIFLLLFWLFGGKFYLALFDKTYDIEQTARMIVIIFLSLFIILPCIFLLKNIINLVFIKKKVKGQVGFICKKEFNHKGDSRDNNKYYYNVYLPKNNECYVINSISVSRKLKERDLVILIKILNNYYLIKCEESRFL